jgi:hypothetical protein
MQKKHRNVRILIIVGFILLTISGVVVVMSRHLFAPATGSIKAIDTTATITDPAWFKSAYKDGFRLYILHATEWGTCNPWPRAQTQLQMALDAGLKIGIYTRDPNCWSAGIRATGPLKDKLQFFALDIETEPGIAVTRAMVDGIKQLGVRPIIYSGSGMWADVQGSSTADFSDLPLWDASPSDFDVSRWQANTLQPTPVAYGGWNVNGHMRVGVQQQFEYKLNGVAVDLNSFDASFLR